MQGWVQSRRLHALVCAEMPSRGAGSGAVTRCAHAPPSQGARRLGFPAFLATLPLLADARGCTEAEIARRVAASEGPSRTAVTTPEVVRLAERQAFVGEPAGVDGLGQGEGRERAVQRCPPPPHAEGRACLHGRVVKQAASACCPPPAPRMQAWRRAAGPPPPTTA